MRTLINPFLLLYVNNSQFFFEKIMNYVTMGKGVFRSAEAQTKKIIKIKQNKREKEEEWSLILNFFF